MAGPPNNIPLRANGYLESGIGLITNLTLSRTLTLTPTHTHTHTHTRHDGLSLRQSTNGSLTAGAREPIRKLPEPVAAASYLLADGSASAALGLLVGLGQSPVAGAQALAGRVVHLAAPAPLHVAVGQAWKHVGQLLVPQERLELEIGRASCRERVSSPV